MITFIVMVSLAVASTVQAELGPRKASELVTVDLALSSELCTAVGKRFDTLLAPGGSQAPFVIPPKRVLVIRTIEILGFNATPGTNVQTRIFGGVGSTVNSVAIRESVADANGRIFHVYQFDPGVVVASGGEVCTNSNVGISTSGRLRGYLARDK